MRLFGRLLILLLASLLIHACNHQDQEKTAPPDANADQVSKDSIVIELVGRDSATVFDLLDEAHEVERRLTAMGVFVTAIDSLANSSSAAWVYTVNDTTPKLAADKMVTRAGDRVKWLYRKQ